MARQQRSTERGFDALAGGAILGIAARALDAQHRGGAKHEQLQQAAGQQPR